MAQAETNLGKGLASIANGAALKRVNSELSAAIQNVLQGSSSTSPSSSSSSGATSASSSANSTQTSPTPATGTGTVPLTANATLSSLGILPGGTFSIDDGTNITKYTSTGDDTVSDLINAINSGPAFVVATINAKNNLVITARSPKDIITVEGSGNDSAYLGFGINNNSFTPVTPKAASGSAAATSSNASSSSSGSTSATSSTNPSSSSSTVLSAAQEMSSSAASILSASGVSGTLVDMLA